MVACIGLGIGAIREVNTIQEPVKDGQSTGCLASLRL
jgi:hypothetical protein